MYLNGAFISGHSETDAIHPPQQHNPNQSPFCSCHSNTAADGGSELSMLTADAACGWSQVGGGGRGGEGEREREKGWAERWSHGAGMLLLRQAKRLHGKSGEWQHRQSHRGGWEGLGVDVTREEKTCDQVKTTSQCGWNQSEMNGE